MPIDPNHLAGLRSGALRTLTTEVDQYRGGTLIKEKVKCRIFPARIRHFVGVGAGDPESVYSYTVIVPWDESILVGDRLRVVGLSPTVEYKVQATDNGFPDRLCQRLQCAKA